MSTFRGIVKEFPRIRIDYFRTVPDQSPPLACFLSHVHSDHLLGLESLKSPFVYCSPATRELLLRLEKYPHRMNFAKGILETRQQTYKHLKGILKTIPLQTPTTIELSPGNEIRVTLFNANHCAGAVMFLIQGQDKAVLYTGDIRSETWLVNQLIRDPILIPYTRQLKRLDCIYLDTTFATKADHYRDFPSKEEGLRELVEKVEQYPSDTVFYIEAWTFGYEDVWKALSHLLGSQIHLDAYRWSLYKSLRAHGERPACPDAAALSGYKCGNHHQPGCLTPERNVRLHSCEHGTGCPKGHGENVVRIVPIISRLKDGAEMHELGIGGGKGDMDQRHELELDDYKAVLELIGLCAPNVEGNVLSRITKMLSSALDDKRRLSLDAVLQDYEMSDNMPLGELVKILRRLTENEERDSVADKNGTAVQDKNRMREVEEPPRIITFPYSRHSSYNELCELVAAFKPKDIYPCTVDETTWSLAVSMRTLFGHLCSADVFVHDWEMMDKRGAEISQQSDEILGTEDEASQTTVEMNGSSPGVQSGSPGIPSREITSSKSVVATPGKKHPRISMRSLDAEITPPNKRQRLGTSRKTEGSKQTVVHGPFTELNAKQEKEHRNHRLAETEQPKSATAKVQACSEAPQEPEYIPASTAPPLTAVPPSRSEHMGKENIFRGVDVQVKTSDKNITPPKKRPKAGISKGPAASFPGAERPTSSAPAVSSVGKSKVLNSTRPRPGTKVDGLAMQRSVSCTTIAVPRSSPPPNRPIIETNRRENTSFNTHVSETPPLYRKGSVREWVYVATAPDQKDDALDWFDFGGLECTRVQPVEDEVEL